MGNKIYSGSKKNFKGKISKGYAVSLNYISLFTIVNNVEIRPYTGAALSRAAGQVVFW